MENQTLYQLALTRIPGVGKSRAKKLALAFGSAKAVFTADRLSLLRAGINDDQARSILHFPDWEKLRKELTILQQKGIRLLFFTDAEYPRRLKTLPESPPLLFYQGTANLNAEKVIAVIGTRRPTEYGRQATEKLVMELALPDCLIISGLAYGIDASAHAAAVRYQVPTIGVLGNGLPDIYPREHTGLARSMLQQGGLLTPFAYADGADYYHFPVRNHLIAGMCDALIVVETGDTGGSHITVKDAHNYNKKIFAVPGRITDPKSRGCLRLIRENKAELLFSGDQLLAAMGWKWPTGHRGVQSALAFPTTIPASSAIGIPASSATGPNTEAMQAMPPQPDPERQLVELLTDKESLSFDDLAAFSKLDTPSVAVSLLNLEIRGLIRPLPGRRYRLNR
jgi:DNA processing protein